MRKAPIVGQPVPNENSGSTQRRRERRESAEKTKQRGRERQDSRGDDYPLRGAACSRQEFELNAETQRAQRKRREHKTERPRKAGFTRGLRAFRRI